jgi:hypothetical protein
MSNDNARRQAFAKLESIIELVDSYNCATTDDERDAALEAIYSDPLEISFRSGWCDLLDSKMDPAEFRIVLCTGGPHVQLRGDLDENKTPSNVVIEYSDWFETMRQISSLTDEEQKFVDTYCQILIPS